MNSRWGQTQSAPNIIILIICWKSWSIFHYETEACWEHPVNKKKQILNGGLVYSALVYFCLRGIFHSISKWYGMKMYHFNLMGWGIKKNSVSPGQMQVGGKQQTNLFLSGDDPRWQKAEGHKEKKPVSQGGI